MGLKAKSRFSLTLSTSGSGWPVMRARSTMNRVAMLENSMGIKNERPVSASRHEVSIARYVVHAFAFQPRSPTLVTTSEKNPRPKRNNDQPASCELLGTLILIVEVSLHAGPLPVDVE